MPILTRSRIAMLVALPAILVPAIEIPLVLWARFTFINLHPEYLSDPPTISRSINDPIVGARFADLVLVITALILVILPVVTLAYGLAISQITLKSRQRIVMYVLLSTVLVLQLVASGGMVLTTQFTFAIDRDIHMLGSYIFFISQALAIITAATLCRILLSHKTELGIADHDWQFRPVMHRFRFRFAIFIVGLVILYGVLFVLKDHQLPISSYVVQIVYTQCEVIVIACYVLFLGSYAVDIHHMVQQDKLRPKVKTTSVTAQTKIDSCVTSGDGAEVNR